MTKKSIHVKHARIDLVKHFVKMYAIYEVKYTRELIEGNQEYKLSKILRDNILDELIDFI